MAKYFTLVIRVADSVQNIGQLGDSLEAINTVQFIGDDEFETTPISIGESYNIRSKQGHIGEWRLLNVNPFLPFNEQENKESPSSLPT